MTGTAAARDTVSGGRRRRVSPRAAMAATVSGGLGDICLPVAGSHATPGTRRAATSSVTRAKWIRRSEEGRPPPPESRPDPPRCRPTLVHRGLRRGAHWSTGAPGLSEPHFTALVRARLGPSSTYWLFVRASGAPLHSCHVPSHNSVPHGVAVEGWDPGRNGPRWADVSRSSRQRQPVRRSWVGCESKGGTGLPRQPPADRALRSAKGARRRVSDG